MVEGESTTQLAGIAFPHVDLDSATAALLAPGAPAVPWRLLNTYSFSLIRNHRRVRRHAALAGREPGRRKTGRMGSPPTSADGPAVPPVPATSAGRPSSSVRSMRDAAPTSATTCSAAPRRHWLRSNGPSPTAFPARGSPGRSHRPSARSPTLERAAQDARIREQRRGRGVGRSRNASAGRRGRPTGRRRRPPGDRHRCRLRLRRRVAPRGAPWVQRLTLEWLFRLVSEPRRLWRRYTIGIVRFCLVVAGDLVPPAGRAHRRTESSQGDRPRSKPRD